MQHIELHGTISHHILAKLRKHPLFKKSEVPESIVSQLQAIRPAQRTDAKASTSAEPALLAKVENRLVSAKNVAPAVKNAVAWLCSEEGAKLQVGRQAAAPVGGKKADGISRSSGGDKQKTIPRGGNEADDESGDSDAESEDGAGGRRRLEALEEPDSEDLAADEAGWESGSVSGGEGGFGGDFDIGVSDDDDSDDADSDVDSVTPPQPKRAKQDKASASSASKPSKAAAPAKPAKPATKGGKTPKEITSSMFLPSLASGFTRGDGDGDSDPDMDYDPDGIIGRKGAPERKNRRGQRARQA